MYKRQLYGTIDSLFVNLNSSLPRFAYRVMEIVQSWSQKSQLCMRKRHSFLWIRKLGALYIISSNKSPRFTQQNPYFLFLNNLERTRVIKSLVMIPFIKIRMNRQAQINSKVKTTSAVNSSQTGAQKHICLNTVYRKSSNECRESLWSRQVHRSTPIKKDTMNAKKT